MKRDAIDFENGEVMGLFWRLLLPTLFGTLSIALVTMADGIFIGRGVGADGVAAVNIVVPIFQIVSGVGLMIGAGCSVAASIQYSQHNVKVARYHVTQAIVLSTIFMTLLCGTMLIFPEKTALILGSSETLLPKVTGYLKYILPCFIFEMWSMIGLFIIRLDGAPKFAMWCNVLPGLLNVVLDWLFIFPLGMGVEGAAIATSISISIGGFMALGYLLFKAKDLGLIKLKISAKSIALALRNVGYHCRIGSSTLLAELALAVMFYIGNRVFMHYLGDTGVGAYGIACYYMPFFFMVGNAIAQSAQPIISYNYGAARWDKIVQARRLLLGTCIGFGLAVGALFALLPKGLVGLFIDTGSEAATIAIKGFPLLAVGILFFILNVAIIGYYQSVERVGKATFFVFLRGLIFIVPAFLLLPRFLGAEGIWLAMPVSEILTTCIILADRLKKAL